MQFKTPILLKADFQFSTYFPPTLNFNQYVLPRVLEAMEFDLQPLLGETFYKEVVSVFLNNKTVQGVQVDGEDVSFTQAAFDAIKEHVESFTMHMAHAHYIPSSNVKNVAYGMVQKKNQQSEAVSSGHLAKLALGERNKATHYARKLCDYLDENQQSYPNWRGDTDAPDETKFVSISISAPE